MHAASIRRFSLALTWCVLIVQGGWAQSDAHLFDGLKYRLIGPFRGGRALAVSGVPGQPEKFYFGAVGGGVWETENAGRTWTPIFDGEGVASIGALAVAPSDPNVIYVGTGEADMRSDIQQGDGMYRSSDAGKTWTHIGLEDTRQIGEILVDRNDANTVYVAALGHQYGPNEERGVFKSTDGGKNWDKVLYKNPDVGAIDLAMDPSDPNTIYAAMWQTRRPPWNTYPPSNGPGSGLYKTTDGGKNWNQIMGGGFPAFVGRVGIAVSPANHSRVYAFVDTNDSKDGGIYRSDDGGATWFYTDHEPRVWGRGWYFAGITADPKDQDTVYVCNTSTYRSTDAGKSFTPIKGAPGGDDYHTLWIYPTDPNRMILASDQGVIVSVDGAKTWSSWYNQPTGQFYHVATDNRFPYWVYGAQQDSGSMAVPSRTIHTGISAMDWRPINTGGESGMIAPDPLHPGQIYGGVAEREQLDTGWTQSVDPKLTHPTPTPLDEKSEGADLIWRTTWTLPLVFSQADPHALYAAHQKIFRTMDGGGSWDVISPDLTRPVNDVPKTLDPATVEDNTGLPRRGVVYTVAPSPIDASTIWAGTDDGLVWVTHDGGGHWKDVTPKELTPWSKVCSIQPLYKDKMGAVVAIDRHRLDDNKPYLYITSDGDSWTPMNTEGIPSNEWINVVREDPYNPDGLLLVGTERSVYMSGERGTWVKMQLNMPPASVRDIAFQNRDIVVGTHGRAFWVLDDPEPIHQMFLVGIYGTTQLGHPWPPQAVFCASPKTYLFQRSRGFGGGTSDEGTPFPPEEPQGQNPAYGTYLDYFLSQPAAKVEFTVYDASGKAIRHLSSETKPAPVDLSKLDIPAYWVHPAPTISTSAGGNRFVWDLRDDSGLEVTPGEYTITMNADGATMSDKTVVLRDPRLSVSEDDLRKQREFALEVRAEREKLQAEAQKLAERLQDPNLAAEKKARLRQLLGVGGGRRGRRMEGTPDMGQTLTKRAFTLQDVIGGLSGLEGAVTGAPSAPLPDYRKSLKVLADEGERLVKQAQTL